MLLKGTATCKIVDLFDMLDTYSSLSKSITVLANFPNPVVIPYTTVKEKTFLLVNLYYKLIFIFP